MTREIANNAYEIMKNIKLHERNKAILQDKLNSEGTFFHIPITGESCVAEIYFSKEEIQEILGNKQQILDGLYKRLEKL